MPVTLVKSKWVSGNLVFYDKSSNIIATWDGTNRKVSFPSGAVLDIESGGSFKIAGTALTPTAAELNYVKDVTSAIQTQLDAKVAKATYTAQTILQATASATPVALTVAEQTLVGRKTGGNIAALAGADALLAMGITPLLAEINAVRYASVEISSAELLALFTTPKSLVAAPGAGNILEFISLLLAYDYGTVVYTIGTATNLQVKYTDGAGVAVSTTQAVTGMLDQATDQLRALDKLEASVTPAVNAALVLTLAIANVTAGNGTIHAKIAYRVHATGL